jgi:hypothetical protein
MRAKRTRKSKVHVRHAQGVFICVHGGGRAGDVPGTRTPREKEGLAGVNGGPPGPPQRHPRIAAVLSLRPVLACRRRRAVL